MPKEIVICSQGVNSRVSTIRVTSTQVEGAMRRATTSVKSDKTLHEKEVPGITERSRGFIARV